MPWCEVKRLVVKKLKRVDGSSDTWLLLISEFNEKARAGPTEQEKVQRYQTCLPNLSLESLKKYTRVEPFWITEKAKNEYDDTCHSDSCHATIAKTLRLQMLLNSTNTVQGNNEKPLTE